MCAWLQMTAIRKGFAAEVEARRQREADAAKCVAPHCAAQRRRRGCPSLSWCCVVVALLL